MNTDTLTFLEALFAPCEQGFLTFTAIHPDGKHPTPSRHVALHDRACLTRALDRLAVANQLGWGAYVAVAPRKMDLGRWRRGGSDDLLALPALFADVDDPSPDTLEGLKDMVPAPSCITFTGGGYHALWWLNPAAADLQRARQVLHALAVVLGGDLMSPAQSLRLVGSCNTKPRRNNALCRMVVLQDIHYSLADFDSLVQRLTPPRSARSLRRAYVRHTSSGSTLNPDLIAAVTDVLIQQGYRRSGDWLSGPCLYAHCHQHGDAHSSFGFNTGTGYGHCFRCHSLLLKDICRTLDIRPADYGGLVI